MQNRLLPIARRSAKLNKLARNSSWLIRKPKILTPVLFVQALVACVTAGYCSLRELAIEVGLLSGKTISKQALGKRFNAKAVKFIKDVVSESLRESIRSVPSCILPNLRGVARILVGDSSTISLHSCLFEKFPGASNQHGKKTAQLRLQFTFDLLGGRWLQAVLDPYRRPDRKAALDIVETIVQAGDLIIRDLGYSTLASFRAIAQKSAFFLSRLQPKVGIMDCEGNRLSLLELSRQHAGRVGKIFSKKVLLGYEEGVSCRLIIIRVPKIVADQRRRRIAKDARRSGRKRTSEHMKMQDWTFLITNLEEEQVNNDQLRQLYEIRWRVENLFRIAKSQTKLLNAARHHTNEHHAEVLIWAWLLLMITLSQNGMFRLLEPNAETGEMEAVETSIFKGIERILQLIPPVLELAAAGSFATLMERLRAQQVYHDRYEKRKRLSIPQKLARALRLGELPALG
jgi:hypothetical protein